ncbi:MAG: glycine cleavage system protein GcvH [Pseudomonadota bacterium]
MSDIKDNLKYTQTHEWVNFDNAIATVGITDQAQHLLGELVYVELPEQGREVSMGEEICVVESTKAASDVYAPIAGKIIAVNDALEEHPELVNQSPYADGWLFKIEPNNPNEIDQLMTPADYKNSLD